MKKDLSFYDYVVNDVFDGIEGISTKHMFSGWGVYKYGNIFALILKGELYFKTDESIRNEFQKRDSHPFSFEKGGKTITTKYWVLPSEFMEDKEKLCFWIERSLNSSL